MDALSVVESGIAAKNGRIKTRGNVLGEVPAARWELPATPPADATSARAATGALAGAARELARVCSVAVGAAERNPHRSRALFPGLMLSMRLLASSPYPFSADSFTPTSSDNISAFSRSFLLKETIVFVDKSTPI